MAPSVWALLHRLLQLPRQERAQFSTLNQCGKPAGRNGGKFRGEAKTAGDQ